VRPNRILLAKSEPIHRLALSQYFPDCTRESDIPIIVSVFIQAHLALFSLSGLLDYLLVFFLEELSIVNFFEGIRPLIDLWSEGCLL
jgi:hypothetical protein